jgi:hypothetical protein
MIDQEKFAKLRDEINSERGDLSLFALVLREDAANKWDLIAAAPWMESDRSRVLKYLAEKLTRRLKQDEILDLSRIIVLEEGNPALEAFLRAMRVERGSIAEVESSEFFGLPIKHAYIFQAKRPETPASANVG